MVIYKLDGKKYFERLIVLESTDTRTIEEVKSSMNQLITRFNLQGKSVISIGTKYGHEEYWLYKVGCTLTLLDNGFNVLLKESVKETKDTDNKDLTYIIGDIHDVVKGKTEKYDVIYTSGLPDPVLWDGENGFSDVMFECIEKFLDKGLFICQSYHIGLKMVDPTSIEIIKEQCKQRNLFLVSIYCFFPQYSHVSLTIIFKGNKDEFERYIKSIERNPQINRFHGRSRSTDLTKMIYPFEKTNVIIVSMERCGSSWLGAIISEVYEAITGKLVKWNHEISRVQSIDSKYDLPQGWNSVYNVSPLDLLKRGYDKVIVLERNLETLKRVFWMSQRLVHKDMPYEDGLIKYSHFFDTIEKYWNIVYSNKIEDPRVLWVNLDDLNSYTFNTFNEIFDFLEFPKNRPILVPVNPPERNWQCFSDILAKGHKPSDTLKLIELKYTSNITEAQIQTQAIMNKTYDENTPKLSDILYKYANKPNPYKIVEEEIGAQGSRSFRIGIDAMVDVLELIKTPNCELCNKEFEVNEDKYSIQEWYIYLIPPSTEIIRCLIVCRACREEKGGKIIVRENMDIIELMKPSDCELCNTLFKENEKRFTIQEWYIYIYPPATEITKCFVVCKKCREEKGAKIIMRENINLIDIMKSSNCEQCDKPFEENEERETIQEWHIASTGSTIPKCFVVCKECRERIGPQIHIKE